MDDVIRVNNLPDFTFYLLSNHSE